MSFFKKLALATVSFVIAFSMVAVALPVSAQTETTVTTTEGFQVVVPVGYEKIPGPSKISQYTDIIKFPGSIDLFGQPRSISQAPVTRTVVQAATTQAATNGTVVGGTNLNDLLLLSLLGNSGGGIFGGNNNGNLGNILVLDAIFGGNGLGGNLNLGSGSGSSLDSGNLGNLFVLDALFSGGNNNLLGGGGILGGGSNDLGELMIYNAIFSGDNGIDLGNLIMLNRLF